MNVIVSEALIREKLIDDCVFKVHEEIKNILSDYKSSQNLCDIIKDALTSSGKMLRTKLLICISLMGDKEISQKVISQAAAVEITHLASLIHDDIIDDSTLRRSHKSTQAKYGKDVAVFAGDFMIAKVFSYLANENLYDEIKVIADTIKHMCNGEVGQNLIKYRLDMGEEEYFENISGKTASFFKTVCYFGARNAGFGQMDTERMVAFGENLGLMFQLKDDLLDLFSNKLITGKEEFSDIREGIYTYPVLLGLKDEDYGEEIHRILLENKERKLGEDELISLRKLLIKSKADTLTALKIRDLADENRFILASIDGKDVMYLEKILEKVENS